MKTDIDLTQLADQANRIFLFPSNLYPWTDIMRGCRVLTESESLRKFKAVDKNTFRALHRKDKSKPVGETFVRYFVDNRAHFIAELSQIRSRADLDRIADEMVEGLRGVFGHLKPSVLATHHKLRKPVDLALESLVTMSLELDQARKKLVPLLFLPLDSKMFGNPLLFTDKDLARFQLSRDSGFGQVPSREAYLELQDIVSARAEWVSEQTGKEFYPAYFDMLWGNRYKNWGGNLFETIPEKRSDSSNASKIHTSTQKKMVTFMTTSTSNSKPRKGPDYLSELLHQRPELLSIKNHIGNDLATNYVKGLNGRYSERLQQGVQTATGLSSDQLIKTINFLIADRGRMGDEDAKHLSVPSSEEGQRALILALWSSREIGVRKGEIANIVKRKRRVYGDEHYLPQPPN